MFDFNWSEIALVGIVALVLIGPKDMPLALRALSSGIRKLRRMAGEFQGHVDDMMRDADLREMRDSINEIRNLNVRGMVRDAVDPDRSMRRAFEDPFAAHPLNPVIAPSISATQAIPAIPGVAATAEFPAPGEAPPAFIPPGRARLGPTAFVPAPPPAFVPPRPTADENSGH